MNLNGIGYYCLIGRSRRSLGILSRWKLPENGEGVLTHAHTDWHTHTQKSNWDCATGVITRSHAELKHGSSEIMLLLVHYQLIAAYRLYTDCRRRIRCQSHRLDTYSCLMSLFRGVSVIWFNLRAGSFGFSNTLRHSLHPLIGSSQLWSEQ